MHVVDSITVWRDQFIQRTIQGASQSKNLKRINQTRVSFLLPLNGESNNINYLIKIKSDTSHFCTLDIGKLFNFCERTRSDPFLVTAGKTSVAAGSGITAM